METKALVFKHQVASIDFVEDPFLPPSIVVLRGKTHICVFNLNTGGCHVMETLPPKDCIEGIPYGFLDGEE